MAFSYYLGLISTSQILSIIYAFNFLIALGIIFVDKKTPTATLAWIMILFVLPVVGILLYLVFSQHINRLKVSRISDNEQASTKYLLNLQREELDHGFINIKNAVTERWKRMILLNLENADALLLGNSDIDLLTDGHVMFDNLIRDIENAKHNIDLCYFIIKDDEIGMKLIDTLTKKAQEGVEVRLLMDAMGSKSITRYKLREYKAAGGKFAFYFEPLIRHLFLRFNYRNHRKIVIIDNEIGYIGGFNIAREYLGLKKKFGYWRDTHLRVQGDTVVSMLSRFVIDWRYASSENIDFAERIDLANNSVVSEECESCIPVQMVSSGPDTDKEQNKVAMMRMITGAERSIYIQTPYLVPDTAMLESLKMAAMSGVDVNVMIPCMPDHPFVYRTTLYNAGELLKHGAKVYIYNNGFLHAKTLVVDGEVSTVGSTNFDIRSFKLNFESNLYIYDANFADRMENRFKYDLNYCTEYTLEDRKNISGYEMIAESVSRLLSEIL